MTRMFSLVRGLGFLALCIGGALVAHRVQADLVDQRQTTVVQTRTTEVDLERAKMSGLNPEEWQRYTTLLRGPRGLWTPALDPIWMLGIHARTDDERRKYAELAVQQEHARVAGELAFQKAYDDAFQLLYGDEPIIDTQKLAANRADARACGQKATTAKRPHEKSAGFGAGRRAHPAFRFPDRQLSGLRRLVAQTPETCARRRRARHLSGFLAPLYAGRGR